MLHMQIARDLLGTRELNGSADNPKIMDMYRTVGHGWVEHDEVAWCAAFVGYCLEKAGLRSTRALNARSYLTFGTKVDLPDAREGDIAVFTRGTGAQGHVAFLVSASKTNIRVLGGNQSDAVSIASYPKGRLLGIRRPVLSDTSPVPSVLSVQMRLRELGYHEVGMADGKYGPRTRAAILAFRADNALLRGPRVLTSGTSYTTPAGCTAIYVELVGGGGGGAPLNGGGAGAYAARYFDVAANTAFTCTIGAGGGSGGSAASGGNTTFTAGTTTVTACGGTGASSGLGNAGLGGAATGGDINISGGDGGRGTSGTISGGTLVVASGGGNSMFGQGGPMGVNVSGGITGRNAGGYGAGGSGSSQVTPYATGSQGLIRIWEFT